MLYFPNAKINIGLHITQKRTDGYHNIETIFYPVELKDVLEINTSNTFKSTILNPNSFEGENICNKAYYLLKKDFPQIKEIEINILKNIPVGAGLGGGSADAAFTLKALNELFSLHLSNENLEQYAQKLGADCAFFIQNKAVYAYEKGDVFEPLSLDLSNYQIILAMPNLHISTAEAYGTVKTQTSQIELKEIIKLPVSDWKNYIKNDFEEALFQKYAILPYLKKHLYDEGAIYASMTGSGACMYGIFPKNSRIKPPLAQNTQIFYT